MAFDQTQFFDLYHILVNELFGDVWLAIIGFLILILFLSIRYKMPFEVTIMFTLLFLAIMFAQTFIYILWVFLVLIVGLLFYYTMSKIFTGG